MALSETRRNLNILLIAIWTLLCLYYVNFLLVYSIYSIVSKYNNTYNGQYMYVSIVYNTITLYILYKLFSFHKGTTVNYYGIQIWLLFMLIGNIMIRMERNERIPTEEVISQRRLRLLGIHI